MVGIHAFTDAIFLQKIAGDFFACWDDLGSITFRESDRQIACFDDGISLSQVFKQRYEIIIVYSRTRVEWAVEGMSASYDGKRLNLLIVACLKQ